MPRPSGAGGGLQYRDRESAASGPGPRSSLRSDVAAWAMEDGLHGVRDGALGEAVSRIRTGSGFRAMTVLSNVVVLRFKYLGRKGAAGASRYDVRSPKDAVDVVSTSI